MNPQSLTIPTTCRVVMMRHGESEWNEQNVFAGWFDSSLNATGELEASAAGQVLCRGGFQFDIAYTSVLTRAVKTLEIILKEIDQSDIVVHKSWRLNERHYGALTGANKAETIDKYGEEQVLLWRRGYDVPIPPMETDHPLYETIFQNPRFDSVKREDLPQFETLKSTIERAIWYWDHVIVPQLVLGKRVLIVAHHNTLRGIVWHLDNLSSDALMSLDIPNARPFVYELDSDLKPVVSMQVLL